MTVPTSYLWKAAQAAEPILWGRLVSGVYDEDKTEHLVSASLERATDRIEAPKYRTE